MASLANVTKEVRLIGKIAAASFFVIIVLFFLYNGGLFIKNTFFPTPLLPPEMAFGDLPPVEFEPQTPTNYTYVVNTVTGTLPIFGDRMMVYKTIKPQPSLVALQETRTDVANVGFNVGETKITDRLYRWSNRQADRLEFDILNGNFKILSNFLNSAPPSGVVGSAAQKDGAYEFVITFLRNIGATTTDLSRERSMITYLKLQNGQLLTSDSQNDAQFVRLDIYQNPLDELPIVYPNFPESTMQFVIMSSGGLPRIVDATFTHNIPNPEERSTYPIKTTEQAYEDLKIGNAVVYSSLESGSSVDITDVIRGYYAGDAEQEYLLPIFIFRGPSFTAYVNALSELITTAPPTQ